MLRLRLATSEIERLDLGGGAWVEVRAASLADYHAASAHAAAVASAVEDGAFALETLGQPLPEQIAGAPARAAIVEWAFNLALGSGCVTSWSGIGDLDGTPLPEPTPATVKLLMGDPTIGAKIVKSAMRRVHEVIAEGEGSAALRSGARKAASDTAGPAGSTESPARPGDGRTPENAVPNGNSPQ